MFDVLSVALFGWSLILRDFCRKLLQFFSHSTLRVHLNVHSAGVEYVLAVFDRLPWKSHMLRAWRMLERGREKLFVGYL